MSGLKLCILVLACVAVSLANPTPPLFTKNYYIEGAILLPYAEIKESFKAFYDGTGGRSRVDYYGDLVLTVQKADKAGAGFGSGYRVSWMPDTNGDPQRTCFLVNGTEEEPSKPQSVIPDVTGFQYLGDDYCPDFHGVVNPDETKDCSKWSKSSVIGEKESTYTFWVRQDADGSFIPVHYLMMGYNSLFGSHFDEYRVGYKNYKQQDEFEDETFDFVLNMTCRSFPGPGTQLAHSLHEHNPIGEFVDHKSDHVEHHFNEFKETHSKEYQEPEEEFDRKNSFRHNFRFINSENRKHKHFSLKVNHLADRTEHELKMMRGRFVTQGFNGGKPFMPRDELTSERSSHGIGSPEGDALPDSFDWRLYGAVNPVKDQAVCGSCWSFGTSGTLEGTYFVKTGKLLKLSEQQLIDCSWNQGDNGCNGGEDFRAYEYIMKAGGLSLAEDYGHYLGQDGKCHDKEVPKAIQLSGFVNVTAYDVDALKQAIYQNGPVTIAINASPKGLTFYSNGVFSDPECKGDPAHLNHQVLAVGYGKIQGKDYWLVKNSWSTYWGNDGYILISQKDNMCGVVTMPTYPLFKD